MHKQVIEHHSRYLQRAKLPVTDRPRMSATAVRVAKPGSHHHEQKQQKQAQEHGFSSLSAVPITTQRPVPEDLDEILKNPGAPRANFTVDREHPHGTSDTPPQDMTVLQQHMHFFTRTDPETIWPADTYRGLRDLGFDAFLSSLAVPVIHGTFSYWSGDSWIPHVGFPIRLKNSHRTKHGSDSEIFDTEGRFVPEKFEEVFSKYDVGNKGGLSLADVNRMVRANRNIMDPVGWTAGWLEWNVSYYLAAQDTQNHGKLLLKEDVRGILDGSLFQKVAQEIKSGKLKRSSIFTAGLVPRVSSPPSPQLRLQEAVAEHVKVVKEKVQEAGNALKMKERKEQ